MPVEPAVGYKISYKGRTAVISGDTKASAKVEAATVGADLLVHEALSPTLVAIQHDAAVKAIDPRCTQIGAFNLALAAWRRVRCGGC